MPSFITRGIPSQPSTTSTYVILFVLMLTVAYTTSLRIESQKGADVLTL